MKKTESGISGSNKILPLTCLEIHLCLLSVSVKDKFPNAQSVYSHYLPPRDEDDYLPGWTVSDLKELLIDCQLRLTREEAQTMFDYLSREQSTVNDMFGVETPNEELHEEMKVKADRSMEGLNMSEGLDLKQLNTLNRQSTILDHDLRTNTMNSKDNLGGRSAIFGMQSKSETKVPSNWRQPGWKADMMFKTKILNTMNMSFIKMIDFIAGLKIHDLLVNDDAKSERTFKTAYRTLTIDEIKQRAGKAMSDRHWNMIKLAGVKKQSTISSENTPFLSPKPIQEDDNFSISSVSDESLDAADFKSSSPRRKSSSGSFAQFQEIMRSRSEMNKNEKNKKNNKKLKKRWEKSLKTLMPELEGYVTDTRWVRLELKKTRRQMTKLSYYRCLSNLLEYLKNIQRNGLRSSSLHIKSMALAHFDLDYVLPSLGFALVMEELYIWPYVHAPTNLGNDSWLHEEIPDYCPGKHPKRLEEMIQLLYLYTNNLNI
eukprot:GHVL01035932.1.p1 GENE.GHVL01035932.1~~GHVL01035932.1.p1  ORF type:complete len:485 (+),score=83.95 GHVL01035932.1:259-1713(+)